MIKVKNAAFGYEGRAVVSGVTCEIEKGSFVGVVGPNGSGKTTFLRGLLGHIPCLDGSVEVSPGTKFSYVPQADQMNLFWPLTLGQTARLGLKSRRVLGRLTAEEEKDAEEAMEAAGLTDVKDLLLREASGGQLQRAVIAQALALRPTVLLLDEPTRGLDPGGEASLLRLVEELRAQRGLTVILVTHTLFIPVRHAGKILLFHEGKTHWTSAEELKKPENLERIYGPGARLT
jgi:ABC-type Mn2+/Zn2+ transport system ATPase subunit